MVNFGILMAEVCWQVWCTHANFNGFRVLFYFCFYVVFRRLQRAAVLARAVASDLQELPATTNCQKDVASSTPTVTTV